MKMVAMMADGEQSYDSLVAYDIDKHTYLDNDLEPVSDAHDAMIITSGMDSEDGTEWDSQARAAALPTWVVGERHDEGPEVWFDLRPSRLGDLRRQKGYSQVQLANRLNISQGQLSDWERGAHVPGGVYCSKLAMVLGVDPGAVLTAAVMSATTQTRTSAQK